jgi:hypothetical protein
MGVSLDELSDGKAIRGFFGGNSDVVAHLRVLLGLKNGVGSQKHAGPVHAIFDNDYRIRLRHLYYQANRDKVSEWNCGI